MSLAGSYLLSKPVRTCVLTAGFCLATVAFALLAMNAIAPIVSVRDGLPGTTPSRAYDLVVGPAGASGGDAPMPQTDLNQLTGGITVAQYDAISRLAGVQVAAPMTMVGYVPMTVTVPVSVPAAAPQTAPQVIVVSDGERGHQALGAVFDQSAGRTYLTAQPAGTAAALSGGRSLLCPGPASRPSASLAAVCWSAATGASQGASGNFPQSALSVPVTWTFLLPLVAVDPVAETKLLHLRSAVAAGSYLPASTARPGSPVPVIMANSVDDHDSELVQVSSLPASAARALGHGLTAGQIGALLNGTKDTVIGRPVLTAAGAYRLLVGSARTSAAAIPAYWTAGPVSLGRDTRGDLSPVAVASDPAAVSGDPFAEAGPAQASAAGFRTVTAHLARPAGRGGPGATLRVVGVFNPALIASSAATPSPYLSAALPGADPQSQRLLGGGSLSQDGNLAGYPSPAATLVMPLQDLGAFTGPDRYTGTQPGKPIGSIRVRVSGVTGDDRLSLERVRSVAQEIVRQTGLHVTLTLASTPVSRDIDLPALPSGQPAVRVSQVWYRSDAAMTVTEGLDPGRIVMSALVLPVAIVFLANGAWAVVLGRRADLAILRALGWRRRGVRLQLLLEFGLIAAGGWLLAVLVAAMIGLAVPAVTVSWWALLAVPAALATALTAAAWFGDPRPLARPSPATLLAGSSGSGPDRLSRRPSLLTRALRRLLRTPGRNGLGVLALALACLALGQGLVVRWAYGGILAGSVLGHPVVWQSDAANMPSTVTVLALAVLAAADLCWLNLGDSAAEFRTLRAIGWPARGLAGLLTADAVVLGLLGGGAAGAAELCACVAIEHKVQSGMLAAAAAMVAAGVLLSLAGAGIAAVLRPGRAADGARETEACLSSPVPPGVHSGQLRACCSPGLSPLVAQARPPRD
jgi:putative ABC transport system permease protein